MKGTALLIASAIALVQGSILRVNKNGCPLDIKIEKLIPHEICNKYYHCTHGELLVKNCAGNLLFNELTQECDWPSEVSCGSRKIEEDQSDNGADNSNEGDNDKVCNCNPAEAPALCASVGSDGALVAHESCDRFYKCAGGIPVTMKCQAGLLYNPQDEICDWPSNVNCGERTIPVDEDCEEDKDNDNDANNSNEGDNDKVCNCNPAEAPALCASVGSDGALVAHERCDRFYKCAGGIPVTMKCQAGLLYNPQDEICDWPSNVNCGERTIPVDEDCEEDKDNDNDADNSNEGDNDKVCNCNPAEASALCASVGSDGALVAHERCDRFYQCAGGIPVTMKCQAGLLYNPQDEICDWPSNVNCGERTIPVDEDCEEDKDNDNDANNSNEGDNDKVCNCNPAEAPALCASVGSDGALVAHERCDRFYKCAGGIPVTMKCQAGLLYNPQDEICDWPSNVNCGERTIPVDEDCEEDKDNDNDADNSNEGDNDKVCNCNPAEAPALCASVGSDGALVAHERCDRFYQCAGGIPVTMKCQAGLLYNPQDEICDWPSNVNCGERTIPVDEDSEEDNDNGADDRNEGDNDKVCNCNPAEAPALCASVGSDGALVAHERCDRFYQCAGGIPVTMKCQAGLLYNPQDEICDWPSNVNCGERTIPVDEDSEEDNDNGADDRNEGDNDKVCNCNPAEAPALCASVGSDGALVAHERCDRFYQCAGGIPVTMKCQAGLLYNPQDEICDWPSNVNCGERTTPVDEDCEEDKDSDNGADNKNEGDNDKVCNCNPAEAPALCSSVGSDGALVAHERCDRFYKCAGGIPVTMKCQAGLLYNPQDEICDWPSNVNCGERTIPVDEDCEEDKDNDNDADNSNEGDNDKVCNCNPAEAPALCASVGSDGALVAHERCDRFYQCAGGIPVTMKCQAGLLYNPQDEICDWPSNVNCGERTIPVDEDSEEDNDNGADNSNEGDNDKVCNCNPAEAPALCASVGSDGALVAHERCDRFYQCAGGIPVTMKCQAGLLYNPQDEICDWPSNVNCGERTTPVDEDCEEDKDSDNGADNKNEGDNDKVCNCNPAEAPALCASVGSDGALVAHERCDRFYKCAGGIPVTMKCQAGLLYNPQDEICDWPSNVNCGERTIPVDEDSEEDNDNGADDKNEGDNDKVCNCNPAEAPALCASFGSDGALVAHERCDRFYKCAGGIPVTMKCQAGLLYNPQDEICDWPSNVNCGERTTPVDEDCEEDKDSDNGADNKNEGDNDKVCNCNPAEAPALCASVGSDGALVAHERCDRFYKCAGGIPVTMKCQAGLLYNPQDEICDWPSNVNCGERTIPVDEDSEEDNDNGADDRNEGDNDKVCNCNPAEAPALCASFGSDGALVAHERCDRFYKCAGGIPVTMKCQAGLLYNPQDEICDWPSNVNCGERTTPVDEDCEEDKDSDNGADNKNEGDNDKVCNCNPAEAPALCASVGSDGALVAHERCDRFYQCAGGIPVTMKCQAGLLYNPQDEICDWPSNVNCGERTTPVDEDCEEDKDSDNGADNKNEGDNDKVCNCNPAEAPALCASVGSDGALVAHERCDRFYKCAGGIPVTMKCQAGLLYNPQDEICDWPSNVNCGERTIPVDEDSEEDNDNGADDKNEGDNDKVCNCNPAEAPALCASFGSDGALVAHERCDRFYKCAGGIPVTMKCQAGLLYNPQDEICDWPSNVNCGERTTPVDEDCEEDKDSDNGADNKNEGDNDKVCNCNPAEAPALCASVGSDGALVAHERCDRFYKCAGGIPVTMKCQAGLLYNPQDEICDWPSNVNCGERTIPVDEDSEEDNDNGADDRNEGDNDKVCNCNPAEAPALCASFGSDGALVAHERCDRFYKCAGGIPVTMKCQAGLLYNPQDEICDWPSNVNCGERTTPVDEDCEEDKDSDNGADNKNEGDNDKVCNCNPAEAPALCASVGSDGALVAHERCDRFYKCAGGIPVTMKCQAGLLYNPQDEICDWPSNVNCGERTIPVDEDSEEDNDNGADDRNEGDNDKVCNCNPAEAPALCASFGSDGALVAHERCDRFYKCAGGIPVTMKCQAGLLYNPQDEICDWPSNVNCGERTIPVDEDCEEDKDSDNGADNKNEGDNDKVCNCNPAEAPALCASVGSDGALVAHESCDRFYKCAGGIPVTMKCQAGLLYNPQDEICDWPSNVNCGERTISVDEDSEEDNDNGADNSNEGDNDKVCNCNPAEAPALCASVGSDGALVAHERCDRFYQCAGGIPVTMKCQAGLLYNPQDEICDWPSNVNCGERTILVDEASEEDKTHDDDNGNDTDSNCDPSEAPALCAAAGSDGILVAHERCDKFYKCAGGIPITMKCQSGLLYNSPQEICDWPQNVNCGERTISIEGDSEDEKPDNSGDDNDSGNNSGNCDPSEAPALCAAAGSDGTLVAHERCDRFYKCAGGIPITMKCQSGLLYNSPQEICDWPQNVNCGERTVPIDGDSEEDKPDNSGGDNESGNNNNGNCDPSEAPTLCAAAGSDGTLVAHERCDSFYKCAGGIPIQLNCQIGLLYNPQQEICDWPSNVYCGNRLN